MEELLVNAALIVLTSALAGGDVTPAVSVGDAPAIVQTSGCSSCGCEKASFLDKIKAKFAPKPHCGCDSGCGHTKPSLFEKLKYRSHKSSSCCEYGPVVSPCATPGAPVVPPATTTPAVPPKEMPKLKEVPKAEAPKAPGATGTIAIPAAPITPPVAPTPGLPSVPAAPITSGSSPY
jgi:hypothetical protein